MTAALDVLFEMLAGASLAGAVVALAVWLLGATFRRLPATTRCALWWLVSLKLIVGLVWLAPVELPLLPPAVASPVALVTLISGPTVVVGTTAPSSGLAMSWRAVLAAVWTLGLAVAAGALWGQARHTARLSTRAQAAGADVVALARALSRRVGLASPPDVRLSGEIDAPMVAGLLRPVIVLPSARWPSLNDAQQAMAICHELVHLRRADLWLGLVPAIAERLFFFHPLARLAAREYLVAREAACDRAVLHALDAAPRDYGQLLLTLGIAPWPRGLSASGAAHSFSSLKRRMLMLDSDSPTRTVRVAGWVLGLAALAALVPLKLVARPSGPPIAAPGQHAISRQSAPGSGLDYTLVLGEKDGTIISGNDDQLRIKAARDGRQRVLWFRRGGQAYEVRDPAAIDQAAAIVQPMTEIGRQQGEIGAKQGAIGAQQGLVGARQGAVGAQQGALGAREGALAMKEARELSAAEKAEVDREHEQIGREMRELSAKMAALDVEMREAEKSMPDFNGEMDKLSKEMDVLSRKMTEASAKADAEMQALVEKLVKLGIAKPVN